MIARPLRLLALVAALVATLAASVAPAAAAPVRVVAQQAPAPWAASATHNGIVYFAFAVPRRIERFRLSDATWLAPIALPRDYILVEDPPSALAVDADGIFVSFRRATYRMALDGTGAAALPNNDSDINGLHTSDGYVYINGPGQMMSVSKATRARVGYRQYWEQMGGTAIARGRGKLYGRSLGISPSEIYAATLNADGSLGAMTESPYHGDYLDGSKVFVFPDESRVVDTSGTVYNAANLTYSGSFAGPVHDLAFYGDLPIVLRDNTLIAFTANLLETGRSTLSVAARSIAVSGATAYAFTAAGERGVSVEAVPLSALGPLQPGAPVDPKGLVYTPDRIILSPEGVVYLLSRANRSIFRWSLAERRYLTTIPLTEAPDFMAYAEPTGRIYLSYQGGRITQIRPAESSAELPLVNAPATPCGLAAAGEFIFVCSPTGAWNTHITYSPDGTLITSKDWNYYSYDFVWSQVNRRMYFLRDGTSPNDLHAEQIGANGAIGAMSETPYHGDAAVSHPIRVSPDGSAVLLGTGRVFDAIGLTAVNQLSNAINDAAWGSSLFTIRTFANGSQLQRWSSGFTLAAIKELPGAPLRLFSTSEGLLSIVNRGGVPQFTLWDSSFTKLFESPADQTIRALTASADSPGTAGSPIFFRALVGAGSPVTFSWEFGDGTTAEGASVSHTYAAPGSYTAKVTARNAVSELQASVTVQVNKLPDPALLVSPGELAFSATVGAPAPASQRVIVSHNGPATLGWRAAADQPWISLSRSQGSTLGALDVAVTPAGLVPGTYTGAVSVTLGDGLDTETIPVRLLVEAAPAVPVLTVTPSELVFRAVAGGQNPAPQSLAVAHNGAGTLTWSASAAQPWISLSTSGGTAPAGVEVQANTAGLAAGSYSGTITVRLDDQRAEPRTVQVQLIVERAESNPIALTARPGHSSIRLEWTPARATDVSSYRVLRGRAEGDLSALATTRDTRFLDSGPGLEAGQTYCYQVEALRANSSVVARSGQACATYGQVGLWAPEVWGAPGSIAIIPVNTRNASGLRIAAADIWLDLDGDVVEPVEVRSTPLSAGYTWSYGVSGSGATTRVRIAALSATSAPLAGDGSLFWLVVRVRGAAGDSSPLNLREYVTGIGGSTIYTPDNLATPVPLSLEDGALRVDAAYGLGDLNGNGTIEAIDAYITLQIAAGQLTPSPRQAAAGDVNGNGRVDPADATLILYHAAHGDWPSPSSGASMARLSAETAPTRLSLASVAGRPGEQVTVTLSGAELSGWAGGRFSIAYDPDVVASVDGVSAAAGARAFGVQHHNDGAGLLTIAMADDESHSLAGELLTITLTLAADAPLGARPLVLADAQLNDALGRDFATSALARQVQRADGELRIIQEGSSFRLHLPLLRR